LLVNLLATPGLGSIMAKRWLEGAGQLALAVAGFGFFLGYFLSLMAQTVSEINGNETQSNDGWMGKLGAVLFAIAWFWSLGTSLSIMRKVTNASPTPPIIATPPRLQAEPPALRPSPVRLPVERMAVAFLTVPAWRRQGDAIVRNFQFPDFPAAMAFVNQVAALAEAAAHHPDIDIRWNRVTLLLTTHDAGGLTEQDFSLARQIDLLAATAV